MKNKLILSTVLSTFALAGIVSAQTGSGIITINADVSGSINLTFVSDTSGVTLTGTGTGAATLPFGNVAMYGGSVPGNVTQTDNGTTSFTLSTPVDIRVDVANSSSSSYTLSASLTTPDAVNVWKVGTVNVSTGAPFAIGGDTIAYASNVPYVFSLTVPASETTGLTISNSINFTASAN